MLICCLVPGNHEYVFIDSTRLDRRFGVYEDDNELTDWEEYWLDGVRVHRSACVRPKRPIELFPNVGDFH